MIRAATTADLAGLSELEATLFGPLAWSTAAVEAELTGPGRTVTVAEDADGGVAGYVVTVLVGRVADLLRIGVRADHQRRGLAGILLTGALEQARAAGAERVMLEVSDLNAPALALYAGHGFSTLDRRRGYYADGSDALVMHLDL